MNFKPIEISDKEWINPLLTVANLSGCHYNFTNLFAWAKIFKYGVARIDDYLLIKGESMEGIPYYFYPIGQGDPKSVIDRMLADALNYERDFILAGLSPELISVINSLFPGKFEYIERRDNFDYVYLLDKLVTLSGDKLKSKRNHINNFKKMLDWSFEPIAPKNLAECWEMNVEWCKAHGCEYDLQLANENCAVRRCFDNFVELGLEGGLLRLEGKVIAYTMGDQLNSDTFDIHIEKAYGEIQGAYQMINREFASHIQQKYPEIVYVNREEDMGYEGLRKSKLSYHPVKMEEKYWGKFVG